MDERLFEVILTLIPVLGAIITYFVVPYIKANIDSVKLSQYKEWATLAVKTAEMLWKESGHGKDKKEYVTDFLNKTFNANGVVITKQQIEILIEAAVKEMKEIENFIELDDNIAPEGPNKVKKKINQKIESIILEHAQ